MRRIIGLVIFCLLLFYNCKTDKIKDDQLVVDIPQVANKTPEEVERILGKPDSAYTLTVVTKQIFTQLYDKNRHQVEIQYPQGKATDIVVNKPMPLPFEPTTLSTFGIQPKGPTEITPNAAMRWDNIPGFEMVSFYVVHLATRDSIDNYKIYFKTKAN